MLNKRAEASETISWIVATFVIVFFLSISIAFASLQGSSASKINILNDKFNDYIATKSFLNFILNDYGLIKISVMNKNEEIIKSKFSKFLNIMNFARSPLGSNARWLILVNANGVVSPEYTSNTQKYIFDLVWGKSRLRFRADCKVCY